MGVILWAFFIFLLRLANVAIATVRTVLVVRGERVAATLLGLVEVLFFVVSLGKVVEDLGNLLNLFAYCVGFAAGTWVGMILENRLALGYMRVHVVSLQKAKGIASSLREEGYGVTEMTGKGKGGRVGIIEVVARRKNVPSITTAVTRVDETAFITVEEAKGVYRGYIPGVR